MAAVTIVKIFLKSFLLLFSFSIYAQPWDCSSSLSTEALIFNTPIEHGSIESRYPGTLARLHVMANDMFNLHKAYQATLQYDNSIEIHKISQGLAQIIHNFNKIKNYNPDARFQVVHRHFAIELQRFVDDFNKNKSNPKSAAVKSYNFNKISASFWELMASCLFDGEKIFLGMRVGQLAHLMPEQFKNIRSGNSYEEKFAIIREIDIAILNKDGSWRWIEVKNWGLHSSMHPQSMAKLFQQSEAQDRIRTFLKIPIRFELMMRYQLPQAEYELYLQKSSYERLHFFFR